MNLFLACRILAYIIVSAYEFVLVVYCVSSWIIRDPFNGFMRVLDKIVSPVVFPVRSILNRFSFFRNCPIDFSVLIVFIICNVILSLL